MPENNKQSIDDPRQQRTPPDGPVTILPVITSRQAECLEFIHSYLSARRDYPTQREVASAMDIRQSSAADVLDALEKKGYLSRLPGARRNIRLTMAAIEKLQLLKGRQPDQLPLFEGSGARAE